MDKRNRDAKCFDPGNERGPEDATVDLVTSIRGSPATLSTNIPGDVMSHWPTTAPEIYRRSEAECRHRVG